MRHSGRGLIYAGLILCLGAAATLGGCAAGPTRAGETMNEQAKTYELKVGDEKAIEGADFTLLVAAVPEDSRCPEGVQCIWAGSVGVELVFCGPKSERSARLNTNQPPRVLKYRGRYIRIRNVSPKKIEGREIKPADYVVTLEITRAAPAAGPDDVLEIADE